MNFSKMYVSITPPEWYRNVIFGVLAYKQKQIFIAQLIKS